MSNKRTRQEEDKQEEASVTKKLKLGQQQLIDCITMFYFFVEDDITIAEGDGCSEYGDINDMDDGGDEGEGGDDDFEEVVVTEIDLARQNAEFAVDQFYKIIQKSSKVTEFGLDFNAYNICTEFKYFHTTLTDCVFALTDHCSSFVRTTLSQFLGPCGQLPTVVVGYIAYESLSCIWIAQYQVAKLFRKELCDLLYDDRRTMDYVHHYHNDNGRSEEEEEDSDGEEKEVVTRPSKPLVYNMVVDEVVPNKFPFLELDRITRNLCLEVLTQFGVPTECFEEDAVVALECHERDEQLKDDAAEREQPSDNESLFQVGQLMYIRGTNLPAYFKAVQGTDPYYFQE